MSREAALFELDREFLHGRRREIPTARLLPLDGEDRDLVPPLQAPEMLKAKGKRWSIVGTEIVNVDGVDVRYEQRWLLHEVTPQFAEEIEQALANRGRLPSAIFGF